MEHGIIHNLVTRVSTRDSMVHEFSYLHTTIVMIQTFGMYMHSIDNTYVKHSSFDRKSLHQMQLASQPGRPTYTTYYI